MLSFYFGNVCKTWTWNCNHRDALFLLLNVWGIRGRSRIFFRRGCTRLLLYFNTNKPHSFFFFCRIPVVLGNRRSSQGSAPVTCRQIKWTVNLFWWFRISYSRNRECFYQSCVNRTETVFGTLHFLFLSHLLYGICVMEYLLLTDSIQIGRNPCQVLR